MTTNFQQSATRRKMFGLFAAGAALVALPGCGRSQGTSRFAMQSAWINDSEFTGYFVAIDKGWYRDEGLDHTYLPGGPEIVADSILVAGRAQVALTTPDTTVNAIVNQGARIKIVGAQYQKNPIGVVSLAENNIRTPQDLVGKRLAVPPANVVTVEAMLALNSIESSAVRIVPYQYDPTPLIRGEVDATIDFVTNVPYTIRQQGREPTSFLLYDHGFRTFNDTVAVLEEDLENRRADIVKWLRASRRGWSENYANPGEYTRQFMETWFRGTGRTLENELYFNEAQKPLMDAPEGYFSMSEASIDANIETLNRIGLRATRDMFVTDLLEEI